MKTTSTSLFRRSCIALLMLTVLVWTSNTNVSASASISPPAEETNSNSHMNIVPSFPHRKNISSNEHQARRIAIDIDTTPSSDLRRLKKKKGKQPKDAKSPKSPKSSADWNCVLEPIKPPTTECKCTDRPYAFKFKYTGGTCDDSENQQTYWCIDMGKLLDMAHIIVTDVEETKVYFDGIVKKDQLFEVKSHHHAFQEYIVVKVWSKDLHNHKKWTLSQWIKFHSDCEKPLYLGDTFGSIEIVGWKNKSQGKVFVGCEDHC